MFTTVQGRRVRLLTRIVSNETNVAPAVLRKAIEWSSWQYLRCYERILGGLKVFPEATVVVQYEVIDQLPRHAKVVSSNSESAAFDKCVSGTLIGQTINAAGPEGKGVASHAFKFVPVE